MPRDPVSQKLADQVPMADPAILEAIGRHEHLGIVALQQAFDANEARFREWVEDPRNVGRAISESPFYLDRIALDSLLERRTWAE